MDRRRLRGPPPAVSESDAVEMASYPGRGAVINTQRTEGGERRGWKRTRGSLVIVVLADTAASLAAPRGSPELNRGQTTLLCLVSLRRESSDGIVEPRLFFS